MASATWQEMKMSIGMVIDDNEYSLKVKVLLTINIFISYIGRALWVVNDEEEMGFRIFGLNFWYYKWSDPHIANYQYREADKREFGETVKSRNCQQRQTSL